MNQLHYIEGKLVKSPVNWKDVYLQGNRENDGLEIATSVKTFQWIGAEAAILRDIFDRGLSKGQGILSGVPHTIKLVEGSQTLNIFEGYIDLQTAEWNKDLVIADSVPELSIEWLDSIADSITFQNLFEQGFLTNKNKVFVPYVISSIPNYQDSMIISVSTIFITTELSNQSIKLSAAVSESSTVVDSIGGVISLIAEILYTIVLVVAVFKLISDLIDLIIQKIKYKPAMSVNDQIQSACDKLGITYNAGVLKQDGLERLHIIPASFSNIPNQSDDRILGFLKPDPIEQTGYYKGTLGDLLREMRELFNLHVVMKDNTLSIQLKNANPKNASFKLPEHANYRFKTNANELISNYTVSFAFDTTEKNTIQSWEGNNVQVTLDYISQPATQQLRLLKGLERRSSSFSRGFPKTELSTPEKLVSAIYKVIKKPLDLLVTIVNGAITVINEALDFIESIVDGLSIIGINVEFEPPRPEPLNTPPAEDVIEARLGVLQLENDFFTVDKLVLLDVNPIPSKTKLSIDNLKVLDAQNIYETYHQNNSFAANNKDHNQRYIYEYENVEVNLTEYQQILNDGAVKLPTGEVCEVISYEYNAEDRLAKFVIKQKKLYTNNLVEVINKPIGR